MVAFGWSGSGLLNEKRDARGEKRAAILSLLPSRFSDHAVFNLNEFPTTLTLLSAIAALARIGESSTPVSG